MGNAPFRKIAQAKNRDEVMVTVVLRKDGLAGDAAGHEMDEDVFHLDGGGQGVGVAPFVEIRPVDVPDGIELFDIEIFCERLTPTELVAESAYDFVVTGPISCGFHFTYLHS